MLMNFMNNMGLLSTTMQSPTQGAIRVKRDEDGTTVSVDPSVNGAVKGMVVGAKIGSKLGAQGAVAGSVIGGIAGCILGEAD